MRKKAEKEGVKRVSNDWTPPWNLSRKMLGSIAAMTSNRLFSFLQTSLSAALVYTTVKLGFGDMNEARKIMAITR